MKSFYLFLILANINYEQNKYQLNSNNLFAFPVIQYFKLNKFFLFQEESLFFEGIPKEENFNQNDTFFLSRNSNFSNLGDSNFFSTYGEKSIVLKQLNEIEKQTEDDNKSNFTIDLDLEKQVDLLLYEDDDLNDLNDAILENDKSNWSSTSNFLNSNFNNNQNEHNMTTPIPLSNNILNNQIRKTIESEDKLINNNILTPANSTIELSKKLLGHQKKDRNKNNEKELNISFLGEKFTDTFTGDSNTNITGNIRQIDLVNDLIVLTNKKKINIIDLIDIDLIDN